MKEENCDDYRIWLHRGVFFGFLVGTFLCFTTYWLSKRGYLELLIINS
jgi:hypothetical protein